MVGVPGIRILVSRELWVLCEVGWVVVGNCFQGLIGDAAMSSECFLCPGTP